jgi:S1-C subfamily serine protease
MAEQYGSRLRKVALTGVLAPALIVGIAGAGAISGQFGPAAAAAESVVAGGACTAFSDPSTAPATVMSVADVAAEANPAVVTVLNMQPLSQANTGGVSIINGLPDIPGMPGIGDLPGSDQLPDNGALPGGDDGDGSTQIGDSTSGDSLVPVGSGSGFIVDKLGHVVTNAHVVDGAQELSVSLADGTEVPATLVGKDDLIDVAVLSLDLPDGAALPGVLAFGDSSALRAGDEVVAIGTALGEFPNTVSEGTVNAMDRAFPDQGGLTTWIQHDAEIWHGNSGGPLLNLEGQVVGVNTAGIGGSELGSDTGAADMSFAVEGNTVCRAAADLIENGKIVWPYLGIQGQTGQDGQTVVDVVEDGPSAAAGLEQGDVITALDDQQVDHQHSLLDLLFAHEPGDVINLTVDRDGASQTFQVTLGERPEETQ